MSAVIVMAEMLEDTTVGIETPRRHKHSRNPFHNGNLDHLAHIAYHQLGYAVAGAVLLGVVLGSIHGLLATDSYLHLKHAVLASPSIVGDIHNGEIQFTLGFFIFKTLLTLFLAAMAGEVVDGVAGRHLPGKLLGICGIAAVLGMLVPTGTFFILLQMFGLQDQIGHLWPMVMATDVGLTLVAGLIALRGNDMARRMLVAFAVIDDILAVAVLFLVFPSHAIWQGGWWLVGFGLLIACALLAADLIRKTTSWRRTIGYFLALGFAWTGFYQVGVEPILGGLVASPMATKTRERFTLVIAVPLILTMFAFGYLGAGLTSIEFGPATWCVAGALGIGKFIGVGIPLRLAVMARIGPMNKWHSYMVAALAPIGGVVSLTVLELAGAPSELINQLTMGALIPLPICALIATYFGRKARLLGIPSDAPSVVIQEEDDPYFAG